MTPWPIWRGAWHDGCRRAEDAVSLLSKACSEYELELNHEKTSVVDPIDPVDELWPAELREHVSKNEQIPVSNPLQPINSEARAKDVRFILENLHSQISRATQEGLLQANEAKHWNKEIQNMLTLLHIDFFNSLGQQALQKGQPGQARLAFERGVQYLRKQPEPAKYQAQLTQLENHLNRANAMVLENSKPSDNEVNQLTEGLKDLDDEDSWKKKSF